MSTLAKHLRTDRVPASRLPTAWAMIGLILLAIAPVSAIAAPAASRGTWDPRMNGYWAAPPPSLTRETAARPGQPDDIPPDADPPARLTKLQRPWAAAIHAKYLKLTAMRSALSLDTPSPDNMCLPFSIPAEGSAAYSFPLEFVVTPKLVVILLDLDHQMRIIRINGTHPAVVKPSWNGDSVGHWEGKTLVVDTIGFNDRAEVQEFPLGWPHTSQMHIVERYHVSQDGTKLIANWTYDDPGALTAPFNSSKILLPGQPFQEFVNAENNVEFPCPTAEAGSPFRPLTMRNLDAALAEAEKLTAAAAKSPKPSP